MSGFQRVSFDFSAHLSKFSTGIPNAMQLLLCLLHVIHHLISRRLHRTVHRLVVQPTSNTTCTRLLAGHKGTDAFFVAHTRRHESIPSLVKFVLDILNSSITERHNSDRCPRNHKNVSNNIKYGLRFSSPRRPVNNTNSIRKRLLYRSFLILVALKGKNNR